MKTTAMATEIADETATTETKGTAATVIGVTAEIDLGVNGKTMTRITGNQAGTDKNGATAARALTKGTTKTVTASLVMIDGIIGQGGITKGKIAAIDGIAGTDVTTAGIADLDGIGQEGTTRIDATVRIEVTVGKDGIVGTDDTRVKATSLMAKTLTTNWKLQNIILGICLLTWISSVQLLLKRSCEMNKKRKTNLRRCGRARGRRRFGERP